MTAVRLCQMAFDELGQEAFTHRLPNGPVATVVDTGVQHTEQQSAGRRSPSTVHYMLHIW